MSKKFQKSKDGTRSGTGPGIFALTLGGTLDVLVTLRVALGGPAPFVPSAKWVHVEKTPTRGPAIAFPTSIMRVDLFQMNPISGALGPIQSCPMTNGGC